MLPHILLLLTGVILTNSQTLNSLDEMYKVVELKSVLSDQLDEYVHTVALKGKTKNRIHKYISKLHNESISLTKEKLEEEMSHPVKVYRFFSELMTDLADIDKLIREGTDAINNTMKHFPKYDDLDLAADAIVRLQELYGDVADFTLPRENNSKDVLTADEMFDIGSRCMDNNNTCGALHYMLRAKELFEAANDVDSLIMTLEHLVDLMEQEGNLDYALNYTLLQIELYGSLGEKETVEVLKDSANHYKHVLGGELKAEEKATLSEAYHCVPSTYIDPNYQQLCKGETVVTEHTDKKPLHCHLYTNNNHPLLRLSPAKIEEINTAFGLNFAHDVLTEREIELLKQAASSKFEASKIVTYDKKTDNFIIQPQSRSSNTGWVFDDENKVIREMSKRVATILDVDVDSAEAYQVLSYGIGGFYTPHHDWGSGDDPFPGHGGNRIATWIFYLNDVKEGGATVFPRIGAAVWPEKGGAAFWRNVYYNGTPNDLNLHAACPVLKGYKWASNKWFHQHRNEFKWPCKLDSEL